MAVLRSDTFDGRGNAAIGTPSDAGSAWSTIFTWTTTTGNVALNSGGDSQATCVLESGESDVEIEVTVTNVSSTTNVGLCARQTDYQNYILATFEGSGGTAFRLFSVTGGSFTTIGSATTGLLTSGVPSTLKLVVNGTSIESFVNGVSVKTATSSAHQTVTRHGLRAHSDGVTTFDDFSISSIGGGSSSVPPPFPRFNYAILNH